MLVRPSVCHALRFLRFLGYFKVGKHIFEYLVSYKQHSRLYKSVGLSVCLSRFAFVKFLSCVKVGKCESRQV